jgi:glycosyltransferase involved in cell wall biosynthesis
MRIVVIEPDCGGHRFAYLRFLIPALRELCQDVILCTTEDAPRTTEYAVHLAPITKHFRLDATSPPPSRGAMQYAIQKLAILAQAISRHRADHVYIPYADGITEFAAACGLLGWQPAPNSVETEGLLMRGGTAHPERGLRGVLQFQAVWTLLRRTPWTIVHFLDPILYERVLRSTVGLAHRSRLMPEPVDPVPPVDRESARRRLKLPVDGRYIGCCGGIDERKGMHLLIRAFAAARLRSDDRLLLAGRQSPGVKRILQTECSDLVAAGRICLMDGYLDEVESTLSMLALDVVCTPYPWHIGSSGIVVRAAAAGRPIVASDIGWLGFVTRRFGLGQLCNVHDRDAFVSVIESSLDGASRFNLPAIGQRFTKFHTAENFCLAYVARLRERLGLPPAEARRTWEWVLGKEGRQ